MTDSGCFEGCVSALDPTVGVDPSAENVWLGSSMKPGSDPELAYCCRLYATHALTLGHGLCGFLLGPGGPDSTS